MSRSSWKPLFTSSELLKQSVDSNIVKERDVLFSFNRATVLTQPMIGYKISVYNGIRFYTITVSSDMLGHRVGEFAPTRKKPIAKKDKKKQQQKKK